MSSLKLVAVPAIGLILWFAAAAATLTQLNSMARTIQTVPDIQFQAAPPPALTASR